MTDDEIAQLRAELVWLRALVDRLTTPGAPTADPSPRTGRPSTRPANPSGPRPTLRGEAT